MIFKNNDLAGIIKPIHTGITLPLLTILWYGFVVATMFAIITSLIFFVIKFIQMRSNKKTSLEQNALKQQLKNSMITFGIIIGTALGATVLISVVSIALLGTEFSSLVNLSAFNK